MGNNEEGAKRGVATKKKFYGEDHFAVIGALGGAATRGRKHTRATKLKMSKSKKLRNKEKREKDDNMAISDSDLGK